MLKFLGLALGIVALAVAAVAAYAATRPDVFRITRSLDMQAPPDRIYSILIDVRRSPEWSPYEKKDPDMKRSFSGAPSGKGMIYEWDGDGNVGAGRIEVIEAVPAKSVKMTLDMVRPMTAHNIVEYRLEPNGNATRVTWDMHGNVPYLAKLFHVFVDVDRMVGKDFEEGLANLKALAER